jgi:serine/threonine protein kinase
MRELSGSRIAHYEVGEIIGSGGMGVVYRAQDVLLKRAVALKLLNTETLTADHRRRSLEEARTISALNHPNIVTVYEIVSSGSDDFIVMEYIDGFTLDKLIASRELSVTQVLSFAIQIADALSAAHAVGIVHRDLKPSNIIISSERRLKLLDFGLAIGQSVESDAVTRTLEGSVVGTVAYMSPEQAEGKRVDARSDIFSFGSVVYEMFAGQQAFSGTSPVSTLAAVLREQPAISHLSGVDDDIKAIVQRCLEKSPNARWQSAADVRMILEDAKSRIGKRGTRSPETANTRSPQKWLYAAVMILVIAGVAIAVLGSRMGQNVQSDAYIPYILRRLTYDQGASVSPAISADGQLVAYSSDRSGNGEADIWVQHVAGSEARQVTSTFGLCHDPVFSPDGSKLVFRGGPEGTGIYLVSSLGGVPRKLADGQWPQFSTDGARLSYVDAAGGRIMIVDVAGGAARVLQTKHKAVGRALWLPNNDKLLYLGVGSSSEQPSRDWYVVSNGDGKETACTIGRYLQKPGLDIVRPHSLTVDGVLIFAGSTDSANIFKVPFNFQSGQVAGDAIPITVAPGLNNWPSSSKDGLTVVFANATVFGANLWRVPLDPVSGVAGRGARITEGTAQHIGPSVSKDGAAISYSVKLGPITEIRVRGLHGQAEMKLAELSRATPPVISPDGSMVAFAATQRGHSSVYSVPAKGGSARRLCDECGRPVQWVKRNEYLLCDRGGSARKDVGILDVSTGQYKGLAHHEEYELVGPAVSDDERYLSFAAIVGGRQSRIYALPFSVDSTADQHSWTTIVDGADLENQPVWAARDNSIYFLSDRDGFRCVWAQRIDSQTLRPRGNAFPVYHLHQFRYSLLDFEDPADVGLSITGNTMVLAVREIQSNVWLAERRGRARP